MSQRHEQTYSVGSTQPGDVPLRAPAHSGLLRTSRYASGVHLLHSRCRCFLREAGSLLRDAFTRSAREEKVALLGAALVLVVLTWP